MSACQWLQIRCTFSCAKIIREVTSGLRSEWSRVVDGHVHHRHFFALLHALSCAFFSLHYFTTMNALSRAIFSLHQFFLAGKWPDPKRYRFQGLGSGSQIRPEIRRNRPIGPERDPTPRIQRLPSCQLKKNCTFFAMYILVDALLYVFGSCPVIKKRSTLTPTWDFSNYLAGKKQIFQRQIHVFVNNYLCTNKSSTWRDYLCHK